jgi:hypothetical protein
MAYDTVVFKAGATVLEDVAVSRLFKTFYLEIWRQQVYENHW